MVAMAHLILCALSPHFLYLSELHRIISNIDDCYSGSGSMTKHACCLWYILSVVYFILGLRCPCFILSFVYIVHGAFVLGLRCPWCICLLYMLCNIFCMMHLMLYKTRKRFSFYI